MRISEFSDENGGFLRARFYIPRMVSIYCRRGNKVFWAKIYKDIINITNSKYMKKINIY